MRRFTQNELDNIVKDYANGNGLRPYELAEKYNRESNSIIGKLKSIGIYKTQNYRFTKDDVDYLQKNYPVASWDEILQRFPNVSKDSIIAKVHKLGIQRDCSYWNDEEVDILKQHYADDGVDIVQKLLPNKSRKAILSKAYKLGLKTREPWCDKENELLASLYCKYSIDSIMPYFKNRSRDSIIHHAEAMGLQSYDYNPWNDNEDKYIIANWKLMPDILLAKNLGRTREATKCRREYLGLYRQDKNRPTYKNLSKYLRGHIQEWKNESMKQCNYQCVFTGSKSFQIHHLYSMSNILSDVFKIYDIKEKAFEKYTNEELEYILNKFIEEQSKHQLGVCVSKDIHMLFHHLYGQYYNTPEQWYQFEKDYKNDVYKDMT